MSKHRIVGALLAALIWLLPGLAAAQDGRWLERQTKYIALLYPEGSQAEADYYAGFADGVYDEVTGQLGYRPAPPLTLRIYPTMELYRQVNPLAEAVEGVIAHAHTGRREISVALPQTADQTEEERRNNVRHELSHIIAAELSGNKLSVMWQEGTAQLAERPAPQLEIKIDLLRQARERGMLMSWSDLDSPGAMYGNPALGYPQSWSMAAFLIERDGTPTYVSFIKATANAGGFRSALQQAYGVSATELEAAWRAWLPGWIDGGWRAGGAADVGAIQAALDGGRYAEAAAGAEQALAGAADPAERERLATLRDLAEQGVAADSAAAAARAAIQSGDYPAAAAALEQARAGYARLGRADVEPVLEVYAERIAQGALGGRHLEQARSDIGGLRFGSARAELRAAATVFGQLGDQAGRARAEALLHTLNQRMRIAALALLAIVVLGLAWNIDRRRAARRKALPFG